MEKTNSSSFHLLAEQIYCQLAHQFPVCCASDEFYFFPQVEAEGLACWGWDDLTPVSISDFANRAKQWQVELRQFGEEASSAADQLDARLLWVMLQTLREQLQQVAPQQRQPTFHLSVLVAGLAEALESDDSSAWSLRIAGLPGFLQQATRCLQQVPELFVDLGQQMLADLQAWFVELEHAGYELAAGNAALAQFARDLQRCSTRKGFTLCPALFERVLVAHLGCEGDLESIERELLAEYVEMDAILTEEAERLTPGRQWQQAEAQLPFLEAPKNDLRLLYQHELLRLEDHSRQVGLVPELAGTLQPEMTEVPASMAAIRASDAYSARVGYPARGGTFYLYDHQQNKTACVGRTLEYRMTAAHEAWPGHHLLDVCRWNLPRPIRRPLEQPLFYEGWACFAEQLMAENGYFTGRWDRFLLARRRIERAARGLVDIGLQSGRIDLQEAVQLLRQVGYPQQKAATAVPKYALRPGYQVCYTLGLRRMLQLRKESAMDDVGAFARHVLTQGEIGFSALKQSLPSIGD